MVIPKVHHTTTAQSAGYEGLGGGALNKLFAKCINFALLATIIPNLDAKQWFHRKERTFRGIGELHSDTEIFDLFDEGTE